MRKLQKKDAVFMFEWMKEDDITRYFNNDFTKMQLEDCEAFILNSNNNRNIHYAICDEKDEYLGTISMKNIDYKNKNAEYAIVLRKKAIGRGFANIATKEILKIAFFELDLEKIYLCVPEINTRAISFYKKFGFFQEAKFANHIIIENKLNDLLWFRLLREEYLNNFNTNNCHSE